MAYAPHDIKTVGRFEEASYGKTFEYALNDEMILSVPAHGGKNVVFPHLIYVGPEGQDTCKALVKGNVAHVIIDEDENGWVVEKWNIKKHKKWG